MYKLPSPKFRVQNLLQKTEDFGTTRRIVWSAVTNADKYVIYRSYIPYGDFKELTTIKASEASIGEDGKLYFDDTTVGIISNKADSDTTLENLTINTWRGWYYRIQAVRANGQLGNLSDPCSDQEVNLLYNPPFGSYQVGEGKTLNYCSSSDLPTEDDTSYLLEIRARDLNLLQRDGQWVWFFKQKAEGTRCPNWVDTLSQCKHGKNCPLCAGVGLVDGYYDPVKILVRLVGSTRKLTQFQQGLQVEYQSKCWTIWTPILANRDIIVTNDGRRFELLDVTNNIIRGGVITHQDFNIKEKMPKDFVYSLQVPGPLY